MTIIRVLIKIPFVLWFLIAGGLGYMDHQSWETDTYQPLVAARDAKKNEVSAKQAELSRAEEFTRRREEKLKELQNRAQKATKLATEISNLQDATSNQLKWNGFLDKELAIEAFDLGKAELLKRKEAELAELLGEDKPAVFIPTPFVVPVQERRTPDWPHPQTITSDPPAEPFATIWCSDDKVASVAMETN